MLGTVLSSKYTKVSKDPVVALGELLVWGWWEAEREPAVNSIGEG